MRPAIKHPKLVFAGTPTFAATHLQGLLAAGIPIECVYTQADKPAGRGRELHTSPVKKLAIAAQLPFRQPKTLASKEEEAFLQALAPDLMVVVAYGLILPAAILRIPRLGCINVHASLLPRWRGAAPIQRAILAGDKMTGISIMAMEAGLDTGPVLQQQTCEIRPDDSSEDLHNRLMQLGTATLLATLPPLLNSALTANLQNASQATYAHKITKQEARIHWQAPAVEIERSIRAFNPWPIAHSTINSQLVRIHKATIPIEFEALDCKDGKSYSSPQHPPGTILQAGKQGIDVACGQGCLRLLQLQLPGGKPLAAIDILNGNPNLFAKGKLFAP